MEHRVAHVGSQLSRCGPRGLVANGAAPPPTWAAALRGRAILAHRRDVRWAIEERAQLVRDRARASTRCTKSSPCMT